MLQHNSNRKRSPLEPRMARICTDEIEIEMLAEWGGIEFLAAGQIGWRSVVDLLRRHEWPFDEALLC